MGCSLPDSSIHGILQVRILEWVAMSSSREQKFCYTNENMYLIGMNLPDTIWVLVMIPHVYTHIRGFPGGSDDKSACKAGDPGSIPESGRSPEEGNGSPLQYSCLENSMERGTRRAVVHEVAKSQI